MKQKRIAKLKQEQANLKEGVATRRAMAQGQQSN